MSVWRELVNASKWGRTCAGVVPVWGPQRWKHICICPIWKRLTRVPRKMREQGDLWMDSIPPKTPPEEYNTINSKVLQILYC